MTPPIKASPKHRVLISSAIITLAAPAFAGVVVPPGDVFAEADIDASGGLSRTEFATTLEAGLTGKQIAAAFKNADVNRSKEVTRLEFSYHLGEIERPTKEEVSFDAADENGDDFLGLQEFNRAVGNLRSRGVDLLRRFLLADESNDQRITFDEWTLYVTGKAKGPEGASFLPFDLMDQDKDDKLSYGEFTWFYTGETKQNKVIAKFAALDKDESGDITRDEWNPGVKRR